MYETPGRHSVQYLVYMNMQYYKLCEDIIKHNNTLLLSDIMKERRTKKIKKKIRKSIQVLPVPYGTTGSINYSRYVPKQCQNHK